MSRNIALILGHPDSNSYCGALAAAYVQAAQEAGHNIKFFKLGEIAFDLTLHHGYKARQEHEQGLLEVKDAVTWANHLVLVYPIWWGGIPALLKGFIDRVFLPGYAFKYRENSQFWDRLLVGRSAHAIVTMDTPPWYFWLVYQMPGHNQMKKTILEFCGFKPVKITSLGPVRFASPEKREKWLQKIRAYAAAT